MKLILVSPEPAMCSAWQQRFVDLPDASIVCGYFENVPDFDCMVSPANSFGLMDGGIDAAIIRFFGVELEAHVQRRILDEFLGEQPVGTSIIVETGHPRHPFLAHTPTMRVPLQIAHTDNVYRAMRAMLLTVRRHNRLQQQRIEIVLCPGLGTGVGQVPCGEAARQMALAYRNFVNPPTRIDWRLADSRQEQIRYGDDWSHLISPEP